MEEETPTKKDSRDKHCAYFMTHEDHEALQLYAKKAGFRSSGQLVTAIMERLMIGGFSTMAFFKVGLQLQRYAEANGAQYDGGFYFGVRPLPALPDEHIPITRWKKELSTLKREFEQNA